MSSNGNAYISMSTVHALQTFMHACMCSVSMDVCIYMVNYARAIAFNTMILDLIVCRMSFNWCYHQKKCTHFSPLTFNIRYVSLHCTLICAIIPWIEANNPFAAFLYFFPWFFQSFNSIKIHPVFSFFTSLTLQIQFVSNHWIEEENKKKSYCASNTWKYARNNYLPDYLW